MGLQCPEVQSSVEKYVNQKLYFSGVDDTLGRIEPFSRTLPIFRDSWLNLAAYPLM